MQKFLKRLGEQYQSRLDLRECVAINTGARGDGELRNDLPCRKKGNKIMGRVFFPCTSMGGNFD